MSVLNFSDGVAINTSGEYHITRKSDGLYVVGNGMCCPVNDAAEGNELIATMNKKTKIPVQEPIKRMLVVLDDGETYAGSGWLVEVTDDEMRRIVENDEKVSSVVNLSDAEPLG